MVRKITRCTMLRRETIDEKQKAAIIDISS
jgi:hypothetical protein